MKPLIVLVIVSSIIGGCTHVMDSRDINPPAAPRNLWTSTGDNFIELFWDANRERDLTGYNVFVSSSYNGRYDLIGSTRSPYFVDNGARNGQLYYYAVTAFDVDGNESELSRDVAYDIPRPEGYDVPVSDFRQVPTRAGYDFSSYAILPFNDRYTDMYFEHFDGEFYMNVPTDTDIQDMGYTNSLLDVRTAPASGWSPTKDARLRIGHTYVVWTWDDHYAKFRVTALSTTRVVFDWAYQLQRSNPMLKRPPLDERGPLTLVHRDR